jgi:dipeptidase E
MHADKTRKIILHGGGRVNFSDSTIKSMFEGKPILFIPYARPSGITYKQYTDSQRKKLEDRYEISGINEYKNPKAAVRDAEAIFMGGGNTFILINTLYKLGLLKEIKRRVNEGMPYIGASAGANVGGRTIMTTNDMPIVYPPSFKAMGFVPFVINPHYPTSKAAKTVGETRETRINEYLTFNKSIVVALNEGAMLHIIGNNMKLAGVGEAKIFERGKKPKVYKQGANLSFLLK